MWQVASKYPTSRTAAAAVALIGLGLPFLLSGGEFGVIGLALVIPGVLMATITAYNTFDILVDRRALK